MTHIEVIKNCPFDDPDDYIFDVTKIEVIASIAKLIGNPLLPYADWRFNEISGTDVSDSSGNDRNGVASAASWTTGILNNCYNQDTTKTINFGNICDFSNTDSFSFSFWVKSSDTSGYIFAKLVVLGGQLKGMGISLSAGRIRFLFYANNANRLLVDTTTLVNTGDWVHVVLSYNGTSDASGLKIYINKISDSLTILENTLNASPSNSGDLIAFNYGGSRYEGLLDQSQVYTKVLDQSEIDFLYNSGVGTELLYNGYSIDKPTIENLCPILFEGFIESFVVTDTIPNRAGIRFQLSIDGGNTYQWWNGESWLAVTVDQSNTYYYDNETNTEVDVNANITTIARSGNLRIKTFLGSDDSYETPEIDNIEVTYTKEEEISTYKMTSRFGNSHP